MILIEKTKIVGFEEAIRGMRNPLNSWDKSDSYKEKGLYGFYIGPKDLELAMKLVKGGSVHAKFRRMIVVYADVTAPLYWWKEFDTYKVGTVSNSCSTMHTIHKKKFTIDDFSYEHLFRDEKPEEYGLSSMGSLEMTCETLNHYREKFLETNDKKYWWQIIQLLPTSYNQKRTVMLNYEILSNIYNTRKHHKLDEWIDFCNWIEQLSYSELIIEEKKQDDIYQASFEELANYTNI